MDSEYKLMRESMIELDIRVFENTRLFNDYIWFNGKEIIKAYQRRVMTFPEKEIQIEVNLLHWMSNNIELKAQIANRVVFLGDEVFFEKGLPFKIHIKQLVDGTLRFNTHGILSNKLFMAPFETTFKPRQLLNMTYLSKRKKVKSKFLCPFEDELGYADLYWSKREKEQKKYYKTKKEFGDVTPDYRDAIIRRDVSKLDFTMKSSVY